MASLPEAPKPAWPDIYQLEQTDRVQGGAGGIANRQATQLAERTSFLKGKLEDLSKSSKATTLAGYGIQDGATKTELQNGLNTKADKATTLSGYGITDALPLRPNLSNGIDLDDIISTGLYHQPANTNASNGKNYPVALAGQLQVYARDSMVYQTYQSYNAIGIWYRSKYGDNWYPWRRLANSNELNSLVPAGAMMYFAMSANPGGWLKANGALVKITVYQGLFDAIGHTFCPANTTPPEGHFYLPDGRGEFIRGWDDGRGLDAGRGFGSQQHDALQNIAGSFTNLESRGCATTGAFTHTSTFTPKTYRSNGGGQNDTVTFDASRVVRTAIETRPRNIALLACIKY